MRAKRLFLSFIFIFLGMPVSATEIVNENSKLSNERRKNAGRVIK